MIVNLGSCRNLKIDRADMHIFLGRSWYINSAGYLASFSDVPSVVLHRLILPPPHGMEVDHINHDKLDNRRRNLRVATRAENSRNRRKLKMLSSKYKGVFLSRVGGSRPWRAQIYQNYKKVHLGVFSSEDDAAQAYDAAALLIHGEFAHLNFSIETTTATGKQL